MPPLRSNNICRPVSKAVQTEAESYMNRVVQQARGEADRFSSVYERVKKDPELAHFDLWQSTAKEVLQNASRVFYVEPGQVLYLPLEKPERFVDPAAGGPAGPSR